MAPQTEFANPPGGHVGLLTYDSVSGKWYAVLGDADGKIQIEVTEIALPSGAATAAKQLADDHNVTISNASLAVTGTFYPGTQPISAASLPLPAGAATAAKQLADGHNVTVDNTTLAVLSGSDKIFAFESIVEGRQFNTSLAAGSNNLDGSAVGAGKVWMITQVTTIYIGTSPSNLTIYAQGLATDMVLERVASPASNIPITWTGRIFLQEGDFIRSRVTGATLNDDLWLWYAGVQMDVP